MKKAKIAVVGVGNPLAGDDAAGVEIVKKIKEKKCLIEVEKIIIENRGLSALGEVENYKLIVFVDCSDFGGEAGEARFFKVEKIFSQKPVVFSHDLGLRDLIAALLLQGKEKYDIYLFAVQGRHFAFGELMSREVKEKLNELADKLVKFVKKLMEEL